MSVGRRSTSPKIHQQHGPKAKTSNVCGPNMMLEIHQQHKPKAKTSNVCGPNMMLEIVFNNVGQPNMMMGTSMGKCSTSMGKATLNKAKCHHNLMKLYQNNATNMHKLYQNNATNIGPKHQPKMKMNNVHMKHNLQQFNKSRKVKDQKVKEHHHKIQPKAKSRQVKGR